MGNIDQVTIMSVLIVMFRIVEVVCIIAALILLCKIYKNTKK